MYCSLIKKVNISKNEKLTKVSTNKETNYIAIGGTNGFVQIVDLDVSSETVYDEGKDVTEETKETPKPSRFGIGVRNAINKLKAKFNSSSEKDR